MKRQRNIGHVRVGRVGIPLLFLAGLAGLLLPPFVRQVAAGCNAPGGNKCSLQAVTVAVSLSSVCINGQVVFTATPVTDCPPEMFSKTWGGDTGTNTSPGNVWTFTTAYTTPGIKTVTLTVTGAEWPGEPPCIAVVSTNVPVLKVDIEEPDGLPVQTVAAGDSCFRLNPSCFEWQFVHANNEVVAYHATQPIDGLVSPSPPASYNWSVSAGTLNGPTTETPTYVPTNMAVPSTMTTVSLKLRPIAGNDVCMQERTIEVYRDHLERDYQNWGTGVDCGANTYVYYWTYSRYSRNWKLLHSWNCFGSVWHTFDGTHDGYTTNIPSSGFTVTTYDDPIPWSTAVTNIQRGDIVSFYTHDPATGTDTIQHAHTCLGSSSQMYGANNQPIYGVYGRSDGYGHSATWEGGSWRWWTTSSETYYDQMNAGYQSLHPGEGKLINRIKVHRR